MQARQICSAARAVFCTVGCGDPSSQNGNGCLSILASDCLIRRNQCPRLTSCEPPGWLTGRWTVRSSVGTMDTRPRPPSGRPAGSRQGHETLPAGRAGHSSGHSHQSAGGPSGPGAVGPLAGRTSRLSALRRRLLCSRTTSRPSPPAAGVTLPRPVEGGGSGRSSRLPGPAVWSPGDRVTGCSRPPLQWFRSDTPPG